MALYVNTNVTSLNSQNALTTATNSLSTIYERLSSGYRINSAKDDAAGLQISNRMTNQINGLNQANRNANDGIAIAQTVEGAMEEMTTMYQSIRTSALQAASNNYTDTDRDALNQDVNAYSTEITRIAEKTTYNGQTVLTGKGADDSLLDAQGQIAIQAGSNAYDYVAVDLSEGYSVLQTAFTAIDTYYEDLDLDASTSSGSGLSVTVVDEDCFLDMFGESALTGVSGGGIAADNDGNIFVTDNLVLGTGENTSGGTSSVDLSTAVYTGSGATIAYNTDGTVSGAIEFSQDQIYSLINGVETSGGTDSIDTNDNNLIIGAFFGLQVESGGYDLTGTNALDEGGNAVLDVSTTYNAQGCVEWCDAYQQVIDSKRADLGAIQNRLESTISNQSNIAENVSDARSRIQDADYAEETANLSQQTIIQQAATSMLVQANSTTSLALTLLG